MPTRNARSSAFSTLLIRLIFLLLFMLPLFEEKNYDYPLFVSGTIIHLVLMAFFFLASWYGGSVGFGGGCTIIGVSLSVWVMMCRKYKNRYYVIIAGVWVIRTERLNGQVYKLGTEFETMDTSFYYLISGLHFLYYNLTKIFWLKVISHKKAQVFNKNVANRLIKLSFTEQIPIPRNNG